MKKKLLALLLAVMMVAAMLPLGASAEGTIENAADLVDALGGSDFATADGNTVTLKQGVTINESDDIYVPTGVTLVIPAGITLEVTGTDTAALKNLAKSAGSIEISGGILKLPSADTVTSEGEFDPTIWFGPVDSNGRMEIAADGSVTISGLDKLSEAGCTWTVKGNVTVPAGARANLNMTDSEGYTRGVKLVISENAVLTVDGTLRGVAGDEVSGSRVSSSVEIAEGGTLDTTNGKLSLSTKPTVKVQGTFHIGDAGIVTVKDNKEEAYSTQGNISMSVGATITVTENSISKKTIADLVTVSDGEEGDTVALENGQLVPVDNNAGESNDAEAYILSDGKITKYDTVKNLLATSGGAESGDRVVLKKSYDWTKDTPVIGEGVTLVVPNGITLTASSLENAATLMGSQGSIEIQAGGTLTLPNDDQTDAGGDKGQPTDNWVGADDKARMQLTDGTMTFTFGKNPTLVINGDVTVPEHERAFLHVTLDQQSGALGIATTLKSGGTLTVNGELVLATGDTGKGASLKLEGSATATVNGTMTVGAAASLTTNDKLTVNGTLDVNAYTNEADDKAEGTIEGKITVGSTSATININSGRKDAEKIAESITTPDGYEMKLDSNGNWVLSQKTPSGGGGSTGGGTPSKPTYDNTVATATNGSATVTDAKAGETATITATPDKGYKVGTVTVRDESGKAVAVTGSGNRYTFTQPEGKVTVTVTFVWDNPFTDVTDPNQWYYDAVEYVNLNGLMNGTSTTAFSPNSGLTRAQVAQVLYNLENTPAVTGESTFTDVTDINQWYYEPVLWAQQNGVVNGYEDNTFKPNEPVTRQEFAKMMYNYAQFKGFDLTAQGDLSRFPDSNQVGGWATQALSWANGEGVINGSSEGSSVLLLPTGTTTRAQAAQILMNFHKNVVL